MVKGILTFCFDYSNYIRDTFHCEFLKTSSNFSSHNELYLAVIVQNEFQQCLQIVCRFFAGEAWVSAFYSKFNKEGSQFGSFFIYQL